MNVKKRALRTKPRQCELFVEALETNEELRSKKISTRSHAVDGAWKRLAAKLNACGGPQQSIDAWKRIFATWVRRKSRVLRLKLAGIGSKRKLTDLQLRLMKLMDSAAVRGSRRKKDLIQLPKLGQLIIENNGNIELVDEEGAVISSCADKLEFACDEQIPAKNNYSSKHKVQRTRREKLKSKTSNERPDMLLLEEFSKSRHVKPLFSEELLIELRGIRKSLEKQQEELKLLNEMNKLRAQIEYEKAKAKYENFSL